MPHENGLLAIGELARRTGTAASALRYYERIGLLPPGERAGGRRHYPASATERVALVRLYQDAGFTLQEIRQLLATDTRSRRGWNQHAERKIDELHARIAEAQRAKKLLEHALNCSHPDLLTCPRFREELEARLALVPHQPTAPSRERRRQGRPSDRRPRSG